MISLTHTPRCPWTIVSGNDKYSARIQTFEALIAAVEKKLDSLK
jgi:polyphosphate kinase 2 (PPK2 family)